MLLAAIVALVLAAAVPALASSRSPNDSAKGNPGKGNSGHNKDFAGLVDIGGGRQMYMECQGKGRPTVVFVAGAQDRADTWSTTQKPSEQAVLPAIAETNRVCAYDRPGTILATGDGPEDFETSRSDPVDQPTTLQDGVDDLHALLKASGERGPYVLVGHSMGGAISRLYASQYPEDVSGLVLIDYAAYDVRKALTAREWALLKILIYSPVEEARQIYPDVEWFDEQRNLKQTLAAAPLQPTPLVVLSADEPMDLLPLVENGTLPMTPEEAKEFGELLFRANVDARSDLVSQVPGARHITDTDSGHYIHWEQPELVTNAVREVVEAARKKSCALGVKNHGQCVKALKQAQR
jgi:pimeloyl-ACP methyl ester carboxylesterase